jgi:Fe-S-cluster-containing dehydrogenase component/CRP-like cAMP-binding protein
VTGSAIPDDAWRAPLLRGLDPLARSIIAAAASVRRVPAGAKLFGEEDEGDALFVVLDGAVELVCVRRGEDTARTLRTAGRGDTIGEDAILGRRRGATARAREATRVLEIPANLLRRGAGRGADRTGATLADRELRALARQATADLLRSHALGRTLPPSELDLVLDAVRPASFARAERIYAQGDPAREVFLLVDGLVQLQREDGDGIHVQAYLARGDLFGDEEALEAAVGSVAPTHRRHAVAIGPAEVLRLPADVLRTLADRNPGLLAEVRRVAEVRADVQQIVVGGAAEQTTRHVFHDLYRMQMARSLLVIDQDLCVRCGHCAWSCAALHGTSRLVRRGDKVVTSLPVLGEGPRSLMLPNSCQHCKNPACMIDCPTGAIGRDPDGEVWIRAELCTGCGNCAKACPWDNIRMAPRGDTVTAVRKSKPDAARRAPLSHVYPEIAVKCDLCREYDAPACVSTCPTGAILRLDPTRDVAEVAEVLGVPSTATSRVRVPFGAIFVGLGLASALAFGGAAWRWQTLGTWTPGQGAGLRCGIAAAIAIVLLVAYAIPKRVVRLWAHRRTRSRADKVGIAATKPAAAPRSRVRPLYVLHLVLGLGAIAAVVGHAGTRVPDDPTGALHVAFWIVAVGGALLGLAYRFVPRRLSRIEREGLLPEDLSRRRTELVDRLYRAGSGKSDLVKAIAEKILVPYARAPFGSLALFLTGRTLADEEALLSKAINRTLQGRGHTRLQGLPELVKVVVELRALPLRRVLTFVLRGLLPVHVIATGVLVALLALHVIVELSWPAELGR